MTTQIQQHQGEGILQELSSRGSNVATISTSTTARGTDDDCNDVRFDRTTSRSRQQDPQRAGKEKEPVMARMTPQCNSDDVPQAPSTVPSPTPGAPQIELLGGDEFGMRLIRRPVGPALGDGGIHDGGGIVAMDGCASLLDERLRRFIATLKKRTTRRFLDELIINSQPRGIGLDVGPSDSTPPGVRRIQADRYEVFVRDAKGKGSRAFDEVVRRSGLASKFMSGGSSENSRSLEGKTFADELVEYAVRQARRDPRLAGERHYKFGNFSLIVTYGAVDAQPPHIDVLRPNFQFGLILTDDSPATLFFDTHTYAERHGVRTVDALRRLWSETTPMPDNLVAAAGQSRDLKGLLADYGDVLLPERILWDECLQTFPPTGDQPQLLRTGDLISLPGNVIHAGPASQRRSRGRPSRSSPISTDPCRAVLFFSAWPTDSVDVEEYDPDTQYSGVFLCGRLVSLLWRGAGVGSFERRYLLEKLVGYILGNEAGGNQNAGHSSSSATATVTMGSACNYGRRWAAHFDQGKLASFIDAVECGRASRGRGGRTSKSRTWWRDLVERAAADECLCSYNVNDFERVSIDDLATMWEGKSYDVIVYRRAVDQKVILKYPMTETRKGNNESNSTHDVPAAAEAFAGSDDVRAHWEGAKEGDNYRLDMFNGGGRGLFDGANGILRDTEGDAIQCYRRNLHAESSIDSGKKRQKICLEATKMTLDNAASQK